MADEPNKEFTIQVNFSGVEKAILGNFKKQIDDVAKAISTIADVMKDQIKALESIQKTIKDSYSSDSLGGLGTGGAGRGGGGGPIAPHLAGSGGGGVDMSALVRELKTLNSNLERSGGGGTSLFGRRGNSGYSQWDQENSFEIPQYPQGHFTIQDIARQAGSIGAGRWRDVDTGTAVGRREMARREAAYKANDDALTKDHYVNTAYDEGSASNPFRKQWAEITGTSRFARNELGVERGRGADTIDKFESVSAYFGRGGVFNPNTYMNPLRKIAQTGGTLGRFGMQFGNDQSFNPFSDSGRQVGGAIWDNLSMSWGGLNPYLSSEQAKAITSGVAGMGYSQGVAHDMRHMMGDVTQHTNIGIDTQGEIIDKSFRWGMANLHELANFMKHDIPQAAQAARMNVGQFSQQLVQVASSMSNSRGINFYTAMGQSNNLAAGTGMNPGDTESIMNNPVLQWTATQLRYKKTGEWSFGRTQNDPNLAGYMAQAVMTNAGRILGVGSADEIIKWSKAKPGEDGYQQYSQFQTLLALSPGAIPGLVHPSDIYKFTKAKIRHTQAVDTLASLSTEADAASEDAKAHYHDGNTVGGFLKTISGEHSGLTQLTNLFGGTSGKDAAGKKAADNRIIEIAGSRQKLIDSLKHLDTFSHEDKMAILGHHTVVDKAIGRFGTRRSHEVLGDSHRHVSDMVAEAQKRLVGNVKKENNKGGNVKITLSMTQELKRLLNPQMGPGNQSVADGTTSAPSSTPTIDEVYNSDGTHG